ncbi:hypothetical protein FKG94_03080 [Exilibacterium tricleocarpae]|uniref:Virion structural protein n=1 Tax=Exilibacterium tricleocarpae TaxID=2591008 RepID=A0A545U6V6_9GAMM|nr:hypothetical protein [Exilibacterium tricleocarpae]TQV85187.1 hypothetical protein FKG94_03080 [Exilibacterium tricleocarpae]
MTNAFTDPQQPESIQVQPSAVGAVVNNQPVMVPGVAKAGEKSESWFSFFYFRVHVLPAAIDLGNVASEQVRSVDVWNAHLTPQTLIDITGTNVDGVDLNGLLSGVYQPFQLESYTLSVSESGPVVVDTRFTFVFDLDQVTLVVTGARVVLVPFLVQYQATETLAWRTRIVPAFAQEQRAALRRAPRQSIQYQYYLPNDRRTQFEALLQDQTRAYGVPVMWEAQSVGAVAAGAETLLIDTRYSDYRVGELLFLYETDTHNEAIEVQSLTNSQITFSRPVVNAYAAPVAMPMRVGFIQQHTIDRLGADNNLAQVDFLINQYGIVVPDTYPQHRGFDVLEDPTVLAGKVTLSFSQRRHRLDNGIGVFGFYPAENRTRAVESQGWVTKGHVRAWAIRQWLYARQGRHLPFWVPSWQRDFLPQSGIGSSATAIDVEPVGMAGPFDVMVESVDKQRFYRQVTAVAELPGTDRLILAAALGVDLAIEQIRRVSLLRLYRQGSDSIGLNHAGRYAQHIQRVNTPVSTL